MIFREEGAATSLAFNRDSPKSALFEFWKVVRRLPWTLEWVCLIHLLHRNQHACLTHRRADLQHHRDGPGVDSVRQQHIHLNHSRDLARGSAGMEEAAIASNRFGCGSATR